jgi:hypothetical protein
MHQQAILVTANVNLGSSGSLVSIDDIEKHYSTTIAANATVKYNCADPKCGVPVIAVITKLTKQTRKIVLHHISALGGSRTSKDVLVLH